MHLFCHLILSYMQRLVSSCGGPCDHCFVEGRRRRARRLYLLSHHTMDRKEKQATGLTYIHTYIHT